MTEGVLPEELRGPLSAFAEDLKERLPDVRSVLVYGSAARGDYVHGVSDVNVLVIAGSLPPKALRAAAHSVRHWRERIPLSPIFATKDYLHMSADVFPLEFLDMRDAHIALLGADPLESLQIDPANLRHQVEAELKGKLMRLRAAYVRACGNPQAVADLMRDSLASFRIAFQGLLRLHGEKPPTSRTEIMKAVGSDFDLDSGALLSVVALHKGESLQNGDADALFERYLASVERLVDVIDTWSTRGESPTGKEDSDHEQ
ncbi:MAG TPA: nucleotidyltransferase domain-containing protein [Armatimonadota bacterium]|jgi:hypothetical protein